MRIISLILMISMIALKGFASKWDAMKDLKICLITLWASRVDGLVDKKLTKGTFNRWWKWSV